MASNAANMEAIDVSALHFPPSNRRRYMAFRKLELHQIFQPRKGHFFRVCEIVIPGFLYIVVPYRTAEIARMHT